MMWHYYSTIIIFVLDTLCQVEIWRNDLGLGIFSKVFTDHVKNLLIGIYILWISKVGRFQILV